MTVKQDPRANSGDDNPETRLKTLQDQVMDLARKAKGLQDRVEKQEAREKLHEEFKSLVKQTSDTAQQINNFKVPVPSQKVRSDITGDWLASLSFCGFLEGDFAERSYLQMPIILSGGFFLHTLHANILFDPGMGTLVGMRELGVNLAEETHTIFVSHYHPSARFDLHTLLNELGGYCPGRSEKGCVAREKRVPLFCSEALSAGRNGHPPALIPSDLRVADPVIAMPGHSWYLTRPEKGPVAVEEAPLDAPPKSGSLLLRTLPAFHNETCPPGQSEDKDGMSGTTLSAVFVQSPEYGILFTGDTEYRQWSQEVVESLQGRVTVLVANMKTLAYLPRNQPTANQPSAPTSDGWSDLPLTQNQLGFTGTLQLARDLRPRLLVLRALGLECVVTTAPGSGVLRYAPEQLSIIQRAMRELLPEESVEKVIIPGRHEIVLRKTGKVTEEAIVPAFPKTGVAEFGPAGHRFVTQNQALAREIRGHIAFLGTAAKPFLVIEGESGGGKTRLAEAIAVKLVQAKENKKAAVQTPSKESTLDKEEEARLLRLLKQYVRQYDLATVDANSNIYGNVLFGWKENFFHQGDKGHEGFFGSEGVVLILNQLEKLPLSESQRFLDLLEQWEYRRHGEETQEAKAVMVKIVFTTNVPVRLCDNLSADLKNRLLTRRAAIPPLSALTLDERRRDLRLYVTYWCRGNGVILAPGILDRLHEIDLSKGSYRTLRGVLEVSRFLALSAFGLEDKAADHSCNIHVSEEFFEEAMKRNEVSYGRAKEDSSAGVPRRLACLVAIWISYGCVNKITYDELAAKQGRSSTKFNEKLADFGSYFESPGQAWDFFVRNESARLLGDGSLDGYLDAVGASPGSNVVAELFIRGSESDWVKERTDRLYAILFDAQAGAETEVKKEFHKRLARL